LLAPLVACALPATVVLAVVPVATVALDGIAFSAIRVPPLS